MEPGPKDKAKREQWWRKHVEQLKTHNGSLGSYSRAHGLSSEALRYWRNKVSSEPKSVTVKAPPAVKAAPFIPVEIIAEHGRRPNEQMPEPRWVAEFVRHLMIGGVR